MTTSILTLALAYAFLLFALLLAILKSEVGPALKFMLVAFCLGFYLWHYETLQNYLGWPAADGIPQNFELISSYTVEPDLNSGEAGGIYIWVRDLDGDRLTPRSFKLPYHKQVHRKLDDTLRQQRQGERFIGSPVSAGTGQPSRLEFEAVERDNTAHKSALPP